MLVLLIMDPIIFHLLSSKETRAGTPRIMIGFNIHYAHALKVILMLSYCSVRGF